MEIPPFLLQLFPIRPKTIVLEKIRLRVSSMILAQNLPPPTASHKNVTNNGQVFNIFRKNFIIFILAYISYIATSLKTIHYKRKGYQKNESKQTRTEF